MRIRIPTNLDLRALQEEMGVKLKPKEQQKIYYICHCLISSYASHRDLLEEADNPFIPLSSAVLQSIINDYARYLDLLQQWGVIESDGQFILGEKCKGFRFTDQYRGNYKNEVLNDFTLVKAIKRNRKKYRKEELNKMRGYTYLTKWWKDGHFKMDYSSAREWLWEYKRIAHEKLTKISELINANAEITARQKKTIINNLNKEYKKSLEKAELMLVNMERIVEGNYFSSVDDTGKRLHTNLTNLKKQLRNFLTYKGEQLVSIDIKNSQPYLSIALFNKEFWTPIKDGKVGALKLEKIGKEIYKEIRKEKERYNEIITLLDSPKSQSGKGFQGSKYSNLVVSGQMYEFLQERWLNLFGDYKYQSRQEVKKVVLKALYHNPLHKGSKNYHDVRDFESLFPEVARLLDTIKLGEYQRPSHILQRVESYLVLDVICGKVASLNENVPLFTIHDSIVTTISYKDKVRDVMKSVLSETMGVAPILAVELFEPKAAYEALEEMTEFNLDDYFK